MEAAIQLGGTHATVQQHVKDKLEDDADQHDSVKQDSVEDVYEKVLLQESEPPLRVSWGFVDVYEVECFKLYNRLARRGFFEDGEVDSEGDAAKDVKGDDDQHDSVGQYSVEKDEDVNGFEYEHVAERSEQCDDDNEQFDKEQMSEESFDGEAFLAKAFLQFGSGEGLQMEAIVRELVRDGLELEPLCAFMATDRFLDLYRVDGETLFCVKDELEGECSS